MFDRLRHPARIGDELIAEATERALPGRLGLYDVAVTDQSGHPIAFFRGRSYRVTGEVLKEFRSSGVLNERGN